VAKNKTTPSQTTIQLAGRPPKTLWSSVFSVSLISFIISPIIPLDTTARPAHPSAIMSSATLTCETDHTTPLDPGRKPRKLFPDEIESLAVKMLNAATPWEKQRCKIQIVEGFYGKPYAGD
jgi:hypothetical protein